MNRRGHKTTEFWLTLVLTALAAVSGMLPEGTPESRIVLAILAGASVFGYSVSRGIAKTRGGGQ